MARALDNTIAEITIDPETKRVIRVEYQERGARFKCQRCAIFCCRLGPPKLSQKDIERLKLSRRNSNKFLYEHQLNLRSREDGSCVLLSRDSPDTLHKCSVYRFRPTLCRLYPFQFQKLNENRYALRLITCCNGLNTDDGVPINTSFVVRLVKSELSGLIDSDLVRRAFPTNRNFEMQT